MIYRAKNKSLFELVDKHQVRGLVVFRTATTKWMRRVFKDGFSHCFIVLEYPNHSILIDTSYSHSIAELGYQRYKPQQGDTVVRFNRYIDTKCFTFGFTTCVEMVKRFIGLNSFFIFTPYQLYKALKRGN